MLSFHMFPVSAAWRHRDARQGFEVVYFREGRRLEGCTTAVEEGQTWVVSYVITLYEGGATRHAGITARTVDGDSRVELEHDGDGRWQVNGRPAPRLDGCLDVDLESSSLTNALPVRRLGLDVGGTADAPAAYVRALDLGVERLDQTYVRVADDGEYRCFDYAAPVFDFSCRLVYDRCGLVTQYPGLAVRVA